MPKGKPGDQEREDLRGRYKYLCHSRGAPGKMESLKLRQSGSPALRATGSAMAGRCSPLVANHRPAITDVAGCRGCCLIRQAGAQAGPDYLMFEVF